MYKLIISLLTLSTITTAYGATPPQRRGQNTTTTGTVAAPATARSAVSARSAKPANTTSVAARSATGARNTVTRGAQQPSAPKQIAARAGTTQKVVNTGTKITTATQNTAVDQTCQQKFNGCMDAFCMTENTNGGRCQCDAQFADLNKQLQEIEELNQQSYTLATVGVETIETGVNVTAKPQKRSLDLSQWNTIIEDTPQEVKSKTGVALQNEVASLCMERIPECASSETVLRTMYNQQIRSDCAAYYNAIKQQRNEAENRLNEAKRAMRTAAYAQLQSANKYDLGQCTIEFKKCMISTAGCGEDFSQCASVAASDNTNVRKSTSKQAKSFAIKGSVTTIEISASTYDTLDAKKPLCEGITNSCVAVKDKVWETFLREVAPQIKNAELIAENAARQDCIGNISACFQKACKDTIDPKDPDGSYDMCLSRPETMMNVCKVPLNKCGIDTTTAPDSLIWDYVVARLAAMRVDSCTTEVKKCLQSDDRCGKDYTGCVGLDTNTIIRMCPYDKLTGCQKVYTDQGIDIRGDAVYDELSTMVQGIMLNIDNNMLEFCQNAVNESMIRVCGTTENCDALTTDEHIGSGSISYGICYYKNDGQNVTIDYSQCRGSADQIQDEELGRVTGSMTGELGPVVPFTSVINGIMFWEQIKVSDDGNITSADEYFAATDSTQMLPETKDQITQEIEKLQSSINTTMTSIESDPTVQFCMTGRRVQGMKDAPVSGEKIARFPGLTKQMRNQVAASALKSAKENYYKQYDIATEQQMKDYVTIAERQAEIKGENAKDARREVARQSCVSLADLAALPMSPPPPSGWGMYLVAAVVVAAAIAVTVLTAGSGAPLATMATTTTLMEGTTATLGAGALATTITLPTITIPTVTATTMFAAGSTLTAAGVAVVATAAVGATTLIGGTIAQATARGNTDSTNIAERKFSGHHELNQWNYKQVTDTTFEWESIQCHKCVKSTKCISQSYPLFGRPKCKKWAESTTECTDTQF